MGGSLHARSGRWMGFCASHHAAFSLPPLAAMKRWSAFTPNAGRLLPVKRFALDVMDRDLAALPWESILPTGTPIVRVSPAWPRTAFLPFTLPMRIVAADESGFSLAEMIHGLLGSANLPRKKQWLSNRLRRYLKARRQKMKAIRPDSQWWTFCMLALVTRSEPSMTFFLSLTLTLQVRQRGSHGRGRCELADASADPSHGI